MIRAALVIVCMLAATAHADRKKAEQLFNRGEKAYRAQKFLVAAQAFENAYQELPAPELAFSAAQAYRRQYRVDPAHTEYVELSIKYYELYLKERKTGGRVGDAADSLEDMKAELRHLEKTGRLGKQTTDKQPMLAVGVELADHQQAPSSKMREIDDTKSTQTDVGITAMIDGKPVEPDVSQPVTEGEHVVRGEAPGYKPVEQRVKVIAGVPQYPQLMLEPLPGQLEIVTESDATVLIDGRGVGETPLAVQSLPAGTHVVTVLATGRRPVAREVKLERAKTTKLSIELDTTFRRRSVKYVAVGAGALAVIATTSAGFALYWNSDARDKLALLQAGDQNPEVLADYKSSRDLRDQTRSGAFLVGGVALGVGLTAAWLYFFDSASAEGVKVVPLATSDGAGASISARF